MNFIRGLQAFVRIFCAEIRAKGRGTTEPARQEIDWQQVVERRRAISSAGGYRERIGKGMSWTGIVVMVGCWCAAILGATLLAIYSAWIVLIEGREGLTSKTPLLGDSGKLVGIGWILVFGIGWVLAWVGGRISKHPGDRLRFPWRSLVDYVRVAGPPFGLYFVLLWLILHLGVDQAIFGSLLLLGASLMLVEKNQFPGLSDRKSEAFLKNRDLLSPQAWFCGECNKHFLPSCWLVAAETNVLPGYVTQCPECKGGNTQICPLRLEDKCEQAEARCKVCGAPPFSPACHRYSKEREAFWKSP